jgi:hypothetical protein
MIGFKSHSGDTQSSRPRTAHDNPVYRSLYGSASRISFFATCTKSRLFGQVESHPLEISKQFGVSSKPLVWRRLRVPTIRPFLMRRTFIAGA